MQELTDFMGPLGVTGDLVLVLVGVWISVLIFRNVKNGGSKIQLEEVKKVHERDEKIVEQLHSVARSLVLVEERLSHVPTRENLTGLRESIRGDIGKVVMPLETKIDGLDRSVGELEAELVRSRK